MKQHIAFATVIAAALSVGVAAQQTSPQDQSSSDKTVTVVGCLQSAGGSPAGTTGTTGSTSGDQFILTDAQMQPASGGGMGEPTTPPTTEPNPTNPPTTPPTTEPSEPTGTSGSMAGKTFKLTDTQDDNLQQYVNQKVEIKGELQKKDEGAMSNPSATNPSASASDSSQQELKVSSVRSIAPSCSGGQN